MKASAIAPLRQAKITIAGYLLLAVLLPDGQAGVVLSTLCKALNLQTSDQAHRLRKHPTLALALVPVKIQTTGGPQIVNALISWGIPLWIAGLQSGRRSPEYRERLLVIQQNVGAALAHQFFQPPAAPHSAPDQELEVVEALPPGPDPLLEQYRREVERHRQDLEQYRRELNATRRLLAAAIERVLLHEGRLEHLERPRQPQPRNKHGGRPRK
jgi:hypothetical protein